jgi:hypothetical protein
MIFLKAYSFVFRGTVVTSMPPSFEVLHMKVFQVLFPPRNYDSIKVSNKLSENSLHCGLGLEVVVVLRVVEVRVAEGERLSSDLRPENRVTKQCEYLI